MTFLPRAQVLTLEEIHTLAIAFAELGVKKIRVTGGEPLVRKGALELLENIGRIDSLNELVITTNGSQLETKAFRAANATTSQTRLQPSTPAPRNKAMEPAVASNRVKIPGQRNPNLVFGCMVLSG